MIGHRLGGTFLIQSKIEQTSIGTVYLAYDETRQHRVDVTVLDPALTGDELLLRRFRQTALAVSNLQHPNILPVLTVGHEDQPAIDYVVTEHQEGIVLEQWLGRHGPVTLTQANTAAQQLAGALQYAHQQNLVHGNIRLDTILVSADDTLMLMDFGLQAALGFIQRSRSGTVDMPDPNLPPEQAFSGKVDGRTDVFALGVVLYQLLTGQAPFQRPAPGAVATAHASELPPSLRQARSDVPRSVEGVVLKALAKRPAERYQQAGELAADFALAAAGQGEPTGHGQASFAPGGRPPSDAPPAPAETRRRLPILWLALGAVMALAAAVGIAWLIATVASSDTMLSAEEPAVAAIVQSPEPTVAGQAAVTATAAPTVAAIQPTPTPTPLPTATPAVTASPTPPPPTATPVPASPALAAPGLLGPPVDFTASGTTTFEWTWSGNLAPGQAFEVRLWMDGSSVHPGAAEPAVQAARNATWQQTFNVDTVPAVQAGGPGTYFWTVAIVETNPYHRSGPEAPARRIYIGGG